MAFGWLVPVLLLLLASGFYSGTEMGLYCVNRLRLRLQADKGRDRRARMLCPLVLHPQRTILTILLGNNLANYLLTVAGTQLLTRAMGYAADRADFYVAAAFAPLVFVFGDVVPKNWFQVEADRLMLRSAGLLRASERLFHATGVLWLVQRMARLGARLAGHDENLEWRSPRAEVVGLLRESGAEGTITEDQARIIERVMSLSDVRVGAIMVPWRQVTTVPVHATKDQFERIIRGRPYSRLPVVDPDTRKAVGIVTVHSVLAHEADDAVRQCMTPVITVRVGESATQALVRLQQARGAMAIVTDPRDGCVGIVTLKDIVEEIFGELAE